MLDTMSGPGRTYLDTIDGKEPPHVDHEDPLPANASTPQELAECLRRLHLLADSPPLRSLESATAGASGTLAGTTVDRVPLGRTHLSQMLRGTRFPSKAFLLTFVAQCGVDLTTDHEWEAAWKRLAPTMKPGEDFTEKELVDRLQAAEERAETAERQVAELRASNAKLNEFEGLRDRARSLLDDAHARAEDVIAAATVSAAGILDKAHREAAHQSEIARKFSETQRAYGKLIVDQARTDAEQIVREAEAAALRIMGRPVPIAASHAVIDVDQTALQIRPSTASLPS